MSLRTAVSISFFFFLFFFKKTPDTHVHTSVYSSGGERIVEDVFIPTSISFVVRYGFLFCFVLLACIKDMKLLKCTVRIKDHNKHGLSF